MQTHCMCNHVVGRGGYHLSPARSAILNGRGPLTHPLGVLNREET